MDANFSLTGGPCPQDRQPTLPQSQTPLPDPAAPKDAAEAPQVIDLSFQSPAPPDNATSPVTGDAPPDATPASPANTDVIVCRTAPLPSNLATQDQAIDPVTVDAHGAALWQEEHPGDPDFKEPRLTRKQAAVLRAVTSGKSLASAAAEARVSRSTIYRWQQNDVDFIAALNAWKHQAQDSARNRLLASADLAVNALRTSLAQANPQVALAVLKALGVLTPPPPVSADPQVIQRDLDDRETQQNVKRRQERLRLQKLEQDVADEEFRHRRFRGH